MKGPHRTSISIERDHEFEIDLQCPQIPSTEKKRGQNQLIKNTKDITKVHNHPTEEAIYNYDIRNI